MRYESTRIFLESIYTQYHHRKYVHPDPLEFLYDYPDIRDREIVGLIASSFSYGNVTQILKTVGAVLKKMEGTPYQFVTSLDKNELKKIFKGFKHRWHTEKDLVYLLCGIQGMLKEYKTLNSAFLKGYKPSDENILPALNFFVTEIVKRVPQMKKNLLSKPEAGSACKRLHMYLRWMVRKDAIDPGGWEGISPSHLLAPLDVHMFRMCRWLKMTSRKQANQKAVIEITKAFKKISATDPVKYDFSLTRPGIYERIRKKMDTLSLVEGLKKEA